jgi:hypothetical protein
MILHGVRSFSDDRSRDSEKIRLTSMLDSSRSPSHFRVVAMSPCWPCKTRLPTGGFDSVDAAGVAATNVAVSVTAGAFGLGLRISATSMGIGHPKAPQSATGRRPLEHQTRPCESSRISSAS